MKRAFLVVFEQPEKATVNDCVFYVKEAVQTWCGQLRPPGAYADNADDDGDPMYRLDSDSVKVTKII